MGPERVKVAKGLRVPGSSYYGLRCTPLTIRLAKKYHMVPNKKLENQGI